MSPSYRFRTASLLPTLFLVGLVATSCGDGSALGPASFADARSVAAARVVAVNQPPHPVPFKGTLVTTELVPDPNPPAGCEVYLHSAQRGNFTHLGRYTGMGATCAFNGEFGVVDPPFNPGGGPPPYFVTDFTVEQTYTAANGDVLEISGEGLLVQSQADGRSGFFGTALVEGGTGRFAGATGQLDVAGINGVVHYDGWITYQASNRSNP